MKRLVIVSVLLIVTYNLIGQQLTDTKAKPNRDFLKKSKSQKRTGLILLGGGAALFTGGVIAMQHTKSKGENEAPFILGGMAATISGAPFFISSGVNKRKARLELRKQAMLTLPVADNNFYQTSVSLKIDL